MKIVVNDVKTGHSFQKEVDKNKEGLFIGKKIGAEIDGGVVGLEGYKLIIAGGSDKDGTPMRGDVAGQKKASAVIGRGCGARHLAKGARLKKRVCGNAISQNIMQVNARIKDYGSKPLAELGFVAKVKEGNAGEKKEGKTEEKKESEKKEGAASAAGGEAKPAAGSAEAKQEERKEAKREERKEAKQEEKNEAKKEEKK